MSRMWVWRAGYRCRQLLRALEEGRSPADFSLIFQHLDGAARAAFESMSRRDRTHSLRTAQAILRRDAGDSELVIAALLHDAGKGEQQLWHRVAYVLLAELSPALLRSLARPGAGWRGALYRSIHHAQLGAALARSLGCSDVVCRLIEEHHGSSNDVRQHTLQWADEVA